MVGRGARPSNSAHQPNLMSASSDLPAAPAAGSSSDMAQPAGNASGNNKKKSRRRADSSSQKRRCISTACIACRKRKSKCDGALPSCAACASVYGTECIYDPNSDHRRKGVYREKADTMKARGTTLQILFEAILNASEDEVPDIVSKIRACESLDTVAEQIASEYPESGRNSLDEEGNDDDDEVHLTGVQGENELARKMGELRFENGSVRFIGGTSHLIYHDSNQHSIEPEMHSSQHATGDDPITSWSTVTTDVSLITHLINMYFNYHYAYFTVVSKKLFFNDFLKGNSAVSTRNSTIYCSPLLVNAMLALGCHFTDMAGAYGTLGDSRTKGDHFFAEAKRLILEDDEFARPRLVTVQALALMSVREAGCGREAKGWVYSGMSFRMAQDIGLNLELSGTDKEHMSAEEVDARKLAFWGCFVFDKCWSNYLGRLPQLPKNASNVTKFDVFPDEDGGMWSPLTDKGFDKSVEQPLRTRAAALQLTSLCEISSDLLIFFYHPNHIGRSRGKSTELKKLSEIHQRLENWRKALPKEFEPGEGQLPNVILMHMFFHLQYIHLFRPFLKYTPAASPLPAHVSPRRICTANAGAISKLTRLYKKLYGLRQICNIAVYMIHSACTIHLLNLPEKSAKRDITHGTKHLEEIAEDWLCARRTLTILSVLARKWNCELPDEASYVLKRTDEKYGYFSTSDVPTPSSSPAVSTMMSDEGSPSKSQREYSPLAAFSQAPPSTVPLATSTPIDSRVTAQPLAQPANEISSRQPQTHQQQHSDRAGQQQMPHPQRQQQQQHLQQPHQQQSQQPVRLDNMPVNFNPDIMGRWSGPPPGVPSPIYDSPFFPVSRSGITADRSGQAEGRRMSSGLGSGAPNGQDWILNDSARWQQNFEGWAMGGGMGPAGVFMFGENHGNTFNQPATTGDDNQGQVAFEGLDASLSGGGWLPNLD